MKTSFFLLIFFGISAATHAVEQQGCPALPLPSASLNFKAIEQFLKVNKSTITGVEVFLSCLPKEFRKNFTLIYNSRSLQADDVTSKRPRALMFSDDTCLTMTFTGDPEKPHYNEIELIQCDKKNKSFELRKIEFGSKQPHMSRKNPQECIRCHRSDPRPNWDSYPFWPGINHTFSERAEAGNLASLADAVKLNPRYGYLVDPGSYNGPEGYNNPNVALSQRLSALNNRREIRLLSKSKNFEKVKYMVAAALLDCDDIEGFIPKTQRKLFTRSYQATLKETAEIQRKFFIQKVSRLSDLYPDTQAVLEHRNGMDPDPQLRSDISPDFVNSQAKLRYALQNSPDAGLADWSMTFDKGSFSFHDGLFGVLGLAVTIADQEILRTDPDLKPYYTIKPDSQAQALGYSGYIPYNVVRRACPALKQKSLAAFEGRHITLAAPSNMDCPLCTAHEQNPSQIVSNSHINDLMTFAHDAQDKTASVLQSCVNCHTGTKPKGPYIPFDSQAELSKALKTGSYAHGTLLNEIMYLTKPDLSDDERMPKGKQKLTPTERDELRRILENAK